MGFAAGEATVVEDVPAGRADDAAADDAGAADDERATDAAALEEALEEALDAPFWYTLSLDEPPQYCKVLPAHSLLHPLCCTVEVTGIELPQ